MAEEKRNRPEGWQFEFLPDGGNEFPFDLQKQYELFVKSRAKILSTVTLDLHHATTGMAGESGEALDITKKLWIYNKGLNQDVVEHLLEEAGDSLFYIQHLLNILGLSLADALLYNMAKLTKRYPQGYSDKDALARADKAVNDLPKAEVYNPSGS